jgi:antitoxin ParD1/3/4
LTKFAIGAKFKTVNVSLTPELENFVQTKVTSGRYTSASEVVREALRLLEDHDRARAGQIEEFRSEIDRRLASLDRGAGVEGEAVFAKIRQKSAQRRAGTLRK